MATDITKLWQHWKFASAADTDKVLTEEASGETESPTHSQIHLTGNRNHEPWDDRQYVVRMTCVTQDNESLIMIPWHHQVYPKKVESIC
jgi:hypothetical protein